MKKIIYALSVSLLIICFALPLASCSQPSSINFVYGEKDIHQSITDEESQTIAEIFQNKERFDTIPSNGFDDQISVYIDGKLYDVATDGFTRIKDVSQNMYFNVSESELNTIHGIFEKYGGSFPCE